MKTLKLALFIFSMIAVSLSFNSCKKEKAEPELIAHMSLEGHNRPAPATVNFTNKSENAESYVWDFGNGENSTDEHATYEYTEPGLYNVKLQATSSEGATKTTSQFIRVYGTLIGWEVGTVTLRDDGLSSVSVGDYVYLVLYDNAGNIIDYTSVNQVEGFDFSGNNSELSWHVRTYDAAPIIIGMNAAVTVKIFSTTNDYIAPDSDTVVAQTTINTQNHLVPTGNLEPYPSFLSVNDNTLTIDVIWVEQEK